MERKVLQYQQKDERVGLQGRQEYGKGAERTALGH